MGVYENLEIDFAKRTRKILEQYDSNKYPGPENFNVTLLINCFIGLLFLPFQRRNDLIPDISINDLHEWQISPTFICDWGKLRNENDKTLLEFIRHLRNSVAHLRFEAKGNENDILSMNFNDANGFNATIPIENLKGFVIKLAETISNYGT